MKRQTKRGGKREGAGRRTDDPKIPVVTYVPKSELSTFTSNSDVKEQRMQCRKFLSESLAKRAKSLAR